VSGGGSSAASGKWGERRDRRAGALSKTAVVANKRREELETGGDEVAPGEEKKQYEPELFSVRRFDGEIRFRKGKKSMGKVLWDKARNCMAKRNHE